MKELFELARKAIKEGYVAENHSEKKGVFVTLYTYPGKELRGCIGFPLPIYPLRKAVCLAARAAAYEDPRFEPLKEEELDEVILEISILSEPKKADIRQIEIGRHGVIVKYGPFSGLLLPQVAVEEKLNPDQFVKLACLKAGLPPEYSDKVDVYVFEAEIYAEKDPNGNIVRRLYDKERKNYIEEEIKE